MRIFKHKHWILSTLISAAVIASFLLIPGLPKPVDAVAHIQGTVSYLDDLLDVNAPTPSDNQALTWNNATSMWVAENVTGSVANLTDIGDVNIPSPTDNYIVYWNDTASEWQARVETTFNWSCSNLSTCNISSLNYVNATAPTDGQVFTWNATSSQWEATTPTVGSNFTCSNLSSCNISDLGNVNATSPTNNDVFYWNNTAGEWQARAESTFSWNCSNLSVCNITSLGNVNTTTPSDNDIFYWNATVGEWLSKAESTFSCSDLSSCNISSLADVNTSSLSDNDFFFWNNTATEWQNRALLTTDIPNLDTAKITTGTFTMARLPTEVKTVGIIFIIDGVGTPVTTGEKGHLEIPFNCTIQQATMTADQSGSIVVDVWKDTYANFPPTNADNITGTTPPTITTAQKSQDSTLTNWTINITSGDILAYNVDSCTNITRVTLSLEVLRT